MKNENIRSLLPASYRKSDTVTECQEAILDSYPSEITAGDNPYTAFCKKFGFNPNEIKIRDLLAHAELMAGLAGNPTAQSNLKNRLEGKIVDKVEVSNPLAELTDDQLDRIESE